MATEFERVQPKTESTELADRSANELGYKTLKNRIASPVLIEALVRAGVRPFGTKQVEAYMERKRREENWVPRTVVAWIGVYALMVIALAIITDAQCLFLLLPGFLPE